MLARLRELSPRHFGRLVRDEDVQVLHGFDTEQNANAYLQSPLFTADVVGRRSRCWTPDVRVYAVA